MSAKKASAGSQKPTESKVNFYLAWCKRCGNCVAFCPRQALEADEWGYPRLADPERCTACGLCEMLCPDFAITVGEPESGRAPQAAPVNNPPRARMDSNQSPERVAPVPPEEEGKRA